MSIMNLNKSATISPAWPCLFVLVMFVVLLCAVFC